MSHLECPTVLAAHLLPGPCALHTSAGGTAPPGTPGQLARQCSPPSDAFLLPIGWKSVFFQEQVQGLLDPLKPVPPVPVLALGGTPVDCARHGERQVSAHVWRLWRVLTFLKTSLGLLFVSPLLEQLLAPKRHSVNIC